jgi:hypothetical protein
MKLIAHRGNIDGIQREYENRPDYIDLALSKGYDVEIDLFLVRHRIFFFRLLITCVRFLKSYLIPASVI